mgnify:FL=1
MKKIIKILVLLLTISCKAQSPIKSIKNSEFPGTIGAYYKDIDNELNTFEGTYLYTNGSTSLKITLLKKVMQYNGRFYEDFLVGEYQYIENGVEKVNSLTNININYYNQFSHNIYGNSLIKANNRPKCNDCDDLDGLRVRLTINDPISNRYCGLIIKKDFVSGVEVIKINILNNQAISYNEGVDPVPMEIQIPIGEFILIKQ